MTPGRRVSIGALSPRSFVSHTVDGAAVVVTLVVDTQHGADEGWPDHQRDALEAEPSKARKAVC